MKMTVVGVNRMNGVSMKSGEPKPYDMAKILCLQDVQLQKKENYQRSGFGFELMEVDLDPESLSKFSKVTFPAVLDLVTEQRVMWGKLISICTGFKVA